MENEVLEKPASITEFNAVEKGLAELRKDLKGVQFDVTKTEGDKAARAARLRCVSVRTGAAKVYADWNAPMLEKQRGMRALVAKITEEVTKIEGPIDEQIKAEEARKAAIKAAKEAADLARQQAIQARITALAQYPMQAVGKGSAAVAAILLTVSELPITTEFYEHRTGEAMQLHEEVAGKLEEMQAAALAQEQEAVRMAAERADLERQRQEQEAAAKAEEARMAAERAKLAEKQAALKAATEAESARQDDARAEQARKNAEAAAAQRKQQEDAAAAIKKQQDDAAAALRAQQEEIDRQRQALEAEQEAVRKAEREKAEAEARAQHEKEEAERIAAEEANRAENRAAHMSPEPTEGNWFVGRAGAVVTDAPIPGLAGHTGHADVGYYGGYLLAESIWRPADARLMAAASRMRGLLKLIVEQVTDPANADYTLSAFAHGARIAEANAIIAETQAEFPEATPA